MRKNGILIALIFAAFLCGFVAIAIARGLRRPVAAPAAAAGSFEDLDKALPEARLVNLAGVKLDDKLLRHGKVVLAFVTPTCKPCLNEGEFLGSITDRGDVRFYGVISFGDEKTSLKAAEGVFPFEVFYDQGSVLARGLKINRAPIKIFLEDGIIRDVWDGSTKTEDAKAEFRDWLNKVKADR
jgi:hypothetical protein